MYKQGEQYWKLLKKIHLSFYSTYLGFITLPTAGTGSMVVVVVVSPLSWTNQAWKAFFPKKKAQIVKNRHFVTTATLSLKSDQLIYVPFQSLSIYCVHCKACTNFLLKLRTFQFYWLSGTLSYASAMKISTLYTFFNQ